MMYRLGNYIVTVGVKTRPEVTAPNSEYYLAMVVYTVNKWVYFTK